MILPKETSREEATGMEGARRATGIPVARTNPPDPEVKAYGKRRRLTVAYKIRVINTVEELRSQGEGAIGAYLRKEGLYYSSVNKWAQQHKQGLLTTQNPGRSQKSHKDLQYEIVKLKRKLEQTEKKLRKTELVVELQKKLSAILEIDLPQYSEENVGN
jgi:transposase